MACYGKCLYKMQQTGKFVPNPCILFFQIFIYLFVKGGERERKREVEGGTEGKGERENL